MVRLRFHSFTLFRSIFFIARFIHTHSHTHTRIQIERKREWQRKTMEQMRYNSGHISWILCRHYFSTWLPNADLSARAVVSICWMCTCENVYEDHSDNCLQFILIAVFLFGCTDGKILIYMHTHKENKKEQWIKSNAKYHLLFENQLVEKWDWS